MPKGTHDCDRCDKKFEKLASLKNHKLHHEFMDKNSWLKPRGKVWDLNGYNTKNVVKRPKRDFSDERIAQVLRHISTQLWAYCKDERSTTMVEVEAMYAGDNLYIGANAKEHSDLILDVLSYEDSAQAVLEYSTGGKSKGVLARRTTRFAKKLKRLEDASFDDIQIERIEAKRIVDILLTSAPSSLDAATPSECKDSFNDTGELYVVHYSRKGRCDHVEEKFMDILKNADHKDGAIVAGKMRPCATCFGRMKYMNEQGYSVEHGKNPGFLWLGRLLEQEPVVRTTTLKEYKKAGSHISVDGTSGYASDSDSDGDSDIEM